MNFWTPYIAWRNLFRNPRRTLASLLMVAFGAGGLMIYQGFNRGIMNQYRENRIHVLYAHGELFPKGYREKVSEKPWKEWFTEPATVEKTLKALPHVIEVYPRVTFYSILQKGEVTLSGKGEGVISERENRFFDRMNFEVGGPMAGKGQVILGKGLATSLGATVGDQVTVLSQTVNAQMNGLDLTVSGIFHTGSKDIDDSMFRMELEDAQQLLDTNRVEHFAIQTPGVEFWPAVDAAAKKTLSEYDIIPFDELDAVFYKNSVDFLTTQFNFIRLILLVIVGLGIFNMISVGLLERAGEVGALRANGEPRARLFGIFLMENFLIGVFGGIFGIGIATLVDRLLLSKGIPMPPGPGITRQFLVWLEIYPEHYVQALVLPTVTTVIASLFPIFRLLRSSVPKLLDAR